MLKVGFGKADFTPSEPAPLAGYGHVFERISKRVRDPLFVRAIAFEEGDTRAVLLVYDLLMVVDELLEELQRRLKDEGAFLMVHATHTHSSIGGYAPGLLGRVFAGKYRPGTITFLAQAGERAARLALDGLQPARLFASSAILPGLNGNRRDPEGPLDEELTVVHVCRDMDSALLVSYSAHPVIVGERDHYAISADFPGEVVRLLERDFAFATFVQGSLGGVDVLFPKDPNMSVERNLAMMAEPIAFSAANLAKLSTKEPPQQGLRVTCREFDLPKASPSPFFDDDTLAPYVEKPLALALGWLVPKSITKARVQGIRIGKVAVIGTPADLGVRLGLAIKEKARASGIEYPVVASQCSGYIGYLHLPEDYLRTPPPTHNRMARYENVMSFFGHQMGRHVLDVTCNLLGDLVNHKDHSPSAGISRTS